MKLHDLQQRAGPAMVWPPQWVEVVLLASIGAEIRRLGDLQVPTGKRGARA